MEELIYIIEDDLNIQEIIKLSLTKYQVVAFNNAEDVLAAIAVKEPDLCIFDIMLPKISGIEAISRLRSQGYLFPILIISAKDREIDKVKGLDSGSDDYLTKPFGVLELQARVRSLLRRKPQLKKLIRANNLVIDKEKRRVTKDDLVIELTKKEFKLLDYLVENTNRVVEREELLAKIWGYDFIGESRVLDVHIRSLRKKLDDQHIQTIRGVGYRYLEDGN